MSGRKNVYKPKITLAADVYTLACERTALIFDRFDRITIGFSGGKDSTAVLQIALEVVHSHPRFARHLPLNVYFYDEEAIPFETEEYVRRIANRPDVNLTWFCLPVKHRNACSRTSPWWWPWAPESRDLWCRPLPPEAVTELAGFPIWPPEARLSAPDANGLLAPPHLGNTAMVMGIRTQESLIRLRALLRAREHNFIVPFTDGTAQGNLWKAYPIYDWTLTDVWTAPKLKGWDYNRAYDRMEMAGVSHTVQRCSPAFGEEPLQKIWMYAHCFPDVWEKMVERVPGVGAAQRYATTELYAYRDRPEKPADMTWPDFIVHYASQFRPDDAKMIAERLRGEIRSHYRKTTTPIVRKVRNPETGVSWEWLLMIAMRGDFKNRKQAGSDSSPSDPLHTARRWVKYVTELDDTIRAGRLADLAHPHTVPADPYTLMPADMARVLTEAGAPWPPPRTGT